MFVTNIKFCFYNTTGEFNFMLYCIYFYIFTYYIQDQPLKVLETGNSFIDVILNKRGTLINSNGHEYLWWYSIELKFNWISTKKILKQNCRSFKSVNFFLSDIHITDWKFTAIEVLFFKWCIIPNFMYNCSFWSYFGY